jgi:hypothetical protein
MKIDIEIPDTYAEKLETVEEIDPTIREQIEIEVLPQVLRLINDAHHQVDERNLSVADTGDNGEPLADRQDQE